MHNPALTLASASPARKALLEQAGFTVFQEPTGCEELITDGTPAECCAAIARQKMDAYLQTAGTISKPVVTADTLISFRGRIIGKAGDRTEAGLMLGELSGGIHTVHSAALVCLPGTKSLIPVSGAASVEFFELSEEEVSAYLDTGEWEHAAGSYRIQQRGISLISSIEGDYYSIIGLPLLDLFGILRGRIR